MNQPPAASSATSTAAPMRSAVRGGAAARPERPCGRNFLAVPAPCGIDKQPDALFGDGLVQEPVDGATGDLGRQSCLIVEPPATMSTRSGNWDFSFSVSRSTGVARRGINNRHAHLFAHELACQVGFGIDGDDVVLGAENLQGLGQRLVTGQHDQAFAGRDLCSWHVAHDWRSREIMHSGLLESSGLSEASSDSQAE